MKLINYFKKLDRTKRYVILFVLISFIGIFSIGCYNSFNSNKGDSKKTTSFVVNEVVQSTYKFTKQIDKSTLSDNLNKESDESEQNIELDTNQEDSSKSNTVTDVQKDNAGTTGKTEIKKNSVTSKNNKSSESSNTTNNTQTSNGTNTTQSKTDIATNDSNKQKKYVYVQVKGVNSTWVSKQISYDNSLTAYDALKIACQGSGNEIHVKNSAYGGVYVEGIGDLYEKDYGGTSGWKYKVNGSCPSAACSNYNLNEGDTLVWYYAMSMYE